MKIICKAKDYYDYLQAQYGIDEKVVYDRREFTSIPIRATGGGNPLILDYFFKDVVYGDKPKQKIRQFSSKKYDTRVHAQSKKFVMEGKIFHFLLEVGFYHYLFEVERYLDENEEVHLEPSLLQIRRVKHHIGSAPLSMVQCDLRYWGSGSLYNLPKHLEKAIILNPIVKDTWIPKFISADEMWQHLYEYISSLNDKEIIDNRTDKEKIESHGFDKNASFRNVK